MTYAVKIEELATGDISVTFFNKREIWRHVFDSLQLAAKEAERLGVVDSATRKHLEHVMEATDSGYLAPHVNASPDHLRARGFTRLEKPVPR